MKKNIISIIIFLLIFLTANAVNTVSTAGSEQDLQVSNTQQGEEKSVIVQYRVGHDINKRAKRRNRVKRTYTNIQAESMVASPEEISEMKKDTDIVIIEEDIKINALGQVADWGIAKVQAPRSWSSGYTGKGVNIAVVDTGISAHEDLQITGGVSFARYTASFNDDNGHGTHVAGIIGARDNNIGVIGIAPECNVYAVKVLDQNGEGYASDLISGIDWCINNNMDIVNMSLGSPQSSQILKNIIDKAYSNGILAVSAAGNDGDASGDRDTVNYPAKYDTTIGVAATDINNNRAVFSSTGIGIEVSAPGVNIASTFPGNRYVVMSGTSMATPYVTGNLALLKQANPNADHKLLRQKLNQEVIPLGNLNYLWYGNGLIQAPMYQASTQEPESPPVVEEPGTPTVVEEPWTPTVVEEPGTPPAVEEPEYSIPVEKPEYRPPVQEPENLPPAQETEYPFPAQEPVDQPPTQGPVYQPPAQGGAVYKPPSQGGPANKPPAQGGPVYQPPVQGPVNQAPPQESAYQPAQGSVYQAPQNVEPGIIDILVNGESIDFSKYNNITPIIKEGRVLLPIRAIAESLGFIVDWDPESMTVMINTQGSAYQASKQSEPGIINVLVNGEFIDFSKYNNVSPIIMEGRTLLPIRAVAESLGLIVDWNPESMTVMIEHDFPVYSTEKF